MKQKHLDHYMRVVDDLASLSYAKRSRVGALVITPSGATFSGYNGSMPGHDNNCEQREYMDSDAGGWLDPEEIETTWPYVEELTNRRYSLKTLSSVIHGEINALAKMLNEGVSAKGSTLLVSLSPCSECSKWIALAGIKEVVYKEEYRDRQGLYFLIKCGITVMQYKKVDENA